MNVYQIIGIVWFINAVIICIMKAMANDYNNLSYINKFISKHTGAFDICYFITTIMALCLLFIE